jgi:hypothetical protein
MGVAGVASAQARQNRAENAEGFYKIIEPRCRELRGSSNLIQHVSETEIADILLCKQRAKFPKYRRHGKTVPFPFHLLAPRRLLIAPRAVAG